jgi:trk system potassium uptake protein TrkH
MQILMILRILGILLCGEAVMMLPSLGVSLIYGDGSASAFLLSIGILVLIGLPCALFIRAGKRKLFAREGFALVASGWILLSLFGALPFVFSGAIPSFIDALFESTSGFTTTGATILPAVEHLPRGILFWRSFTHWVGGMGVLVLTVAILPQLGSRNMDILRAESSGPAPGKLMPRLRETTKMLYIIYLSLSAAMILVLLICGLPLYDALVAMFATAGTGGFSMLNASIGGYASPVIEMIIAFFMLIFGVNFAVYFALIRRDYKRVLRNQELWAYLIMLAVATLLIAVNILPGTGSFLTSLRYAFFQVTSIATTTGFATTDYGAWPTFSLVIIMVLMVVGASAGSTGGGIKVSRVLLLAKSLRKEIHAILHPNIVRNVSIEGRPIEESTLRSVLVYFFAYVMIVVTSTLVVSLDGFDFLSTFSSVLATSGNIGAGLGLAGPTSSFAAFSPLSKTIFCLCMWVGRLEIMPILLLFTPSLWRRA